MKHISNFKNFEVVNEGSLVSAAYKIENFFEKIKSKLKPSRNDEAEAFATLIRSANELDTFDKVANALRMLPKPDKDITEHKIVADAWTKVYDKWHKEMDKMSVQ